MPSIKRRAEQAGRKTGSKFPKHKPSHVQKCPPAKAAHASRHVDCRAAWSSVETQAQLVFDKSKNDKGKEDPIKRNREITRAYAELFQNHQNLRWLGVAAFASKQVGCAMKKAKSYFDSFWDSLTPVRRLKGIAGRIMYGALADGNRAVFKDVYPVFRFFIEHDAATLRRCKNERRPAVDADVVNAFEKIEQGHPLVGADKILRYEQLTILQKEVYDDAATKELLRVNQILSKLGPVGKKIGAEGVKVSFSAECDGGPEVAFPGFNIADPKHRIPYTQDVVKLFNHLYADDKSHAALMKQLGLLAGD